jgi:hypothetical protein
MKKTILALAVAFCAQGFAVQASATVLNFDSLASVGDNYEVGTTYTESGYTLRDVTTTAYGFATWGTSSPDFSGSTALINNNDAGLTMLTQAGGGAFRLNSIDLSVMYPSYAAGDVMVTFTGTKLDNSVVTQSFTVIDGVTATYSFASGFTNLNSVTWDSTAMYNQFDNVNVVAVPEPENYAMFLAGLGLMGLVARRRNK